jgi:hypothetical protein
MLRYKLRTLLIVLALGPPVLAWTWWGYTTYMRARELAAIHDAIEKFRTGPGDYPPRISYSSEGNGP